VKTFLNPKIAGRPDMIYTYKESTIVFFGTKTIDLYGGGLADHQVANSDFRERFAQRFVFIYEIEEHHQFAAAAAMLIIL
jgi:hypothetical protein